MNTQLHSVGAASREFGRKNGNGAGDDDSGDGTASLVRAEFKRLGAEFQGFASARKVKEGELDARLLAIEQRQARSGGGAGGSGDGLGGSTSLGTAAEPLVKALKNTNSSRSEVAVSIKSLSSTATGALGSTQYSVPVQVLAPVDTYHSPLQRLSDLLPVEPVTSNMLAYMRVAFAANNAAKAAELTLKGESTLTTTLIQTEIDTFAHFLTASRQVLSDVQVLRSLIDGLLQRGLLDKVDLASYATLTMAGNFTPFVATVGDRFGDAVARIAAELANVGARGVIVCLSPLDYLAMSLAKTSGSGEYLALPPTLSARVVAVTAVAPGKILAFAPTTGAAYADRQSVIVEAAYSGTGFVENRVTLLCEARGQTFVRDPQHVAFGSLPATA